MENKPFTHVCKVDGHPGPSYHIWLVDFKFDKDSEYNYRYWAIATWNDEEGDGEFELDDEGEYLCTYNNLTDEVTVLSFKESCVRLISGSNYGPKKNPLSISNTKEEALGCILVQMELS